MKKHISITLIACCFTILIYAQWGEVSGPIMNPPAPWYCDCYDYWAIGSNSTMYCCINCGCAEGSSFYSFFKLYKTENTGLNWTLKYNGNYDYASLNEWHFISGDTGFIVRNDGGGEILERTPNGLTHIYWCSTCGFPYYTTYKMIDFHNMVAVWNITNYKKFLKFEIDSFKTIYNFPSPYLTSFIKIETINNNFYLLGHKDGSTDDLVLKSSDGGYNWDTSFYNPVHNLVDIKFSSDSIGFMVGNNGLIYKTENAGSTWENKETPTVKNLKSIDYLNESTWIAVGDSGKIIMTYDGGATWFSKTSPTVLTLIEVRFPEKDDIVMVRSEERLWKTNINNLTSVSELGQQSLLMNLFPNPAKDKITISSPAITGNTLLSIFNVRGEKVMERQLIATETQMDISVLPRGVYFVRVRDEKMVAIEKLVKN